MVPLARRIHFLRCLPPDEQVGVGCQDIVLDLSLGLFSGSLSLGG